MKTFTIVKSKCQQIRLFLKRFTITTDGKHYVCQCIREDDDYGKTCDTKISSFSGGNKNAHP